MPPPAQNTSLTSPFLILAFLGTLILSVGPGVELINTPEAIFHFPRVYVWGVLWYVLQVIIVLIAYFFVWKDEQE